MNTVFAKGVRAMKNTNVCPKCNSTNILRVDGYSGAYGAGNNIRIGPSIYDAVNVNRYLCCDCGFSEEWIDKEDVAVVMDQYKNKQ